MAKHGFEILERESGGEFSRYRLDRCRDRFGAIVWVLMDAETPDPMTGLADVIRQSASRDEALAGISF